MVELVESGFASASSGASAPRSALSRRVGEPHSVLPYTRLDVTLPKPGYGGVGSGAAQEGTAVTSGHEGRAIGELDNWIRLRPDEVDRVDDAVDALGLPAPRGAERLVAGEVAQRGVFDLAGLVSDEQDPAATMTRLSSRASDRIRWTGC